jgi:uncharacterized protein involved in exopolysaccharide biosynthesis
MSSADSSPPARVSREVLPTPFERRRIWRAVRAQRGLVLAVVLLGLFGGALVSRLSVPLDHVARAEAHLLSADLGTTRRVLDDEVLGAARTMGQFEAPVAELRGRVDAVLSGASDVVVTAHASDAEGAIQLADAVVAAFVGRESARAQRAQEQARADLDGELARARHELAAATRARSEALAVHGGADPELDLARASQRLRELETQIAEARGRATEAQARGAVFTAQGNGARSQKAAVELGEAQRQLSVLLAQHDDTHPEVVALRARIKRLQTRAVLPTSHAVGNRAEARAQAARASALETEQTALAARIERLEHAAQALSPLSEARERAHARVVAVEARRAAFDGRRSTVAEVAARAQAVSVDRRLLRAVVATLTPLVALLLVLGVIVLNEVRGFRVCAATELAHWLGAPVVAVSAWPEHDLALEPLVDTLFDAAVDAPGVTLVVPLSESERPLAHTLAAQINGRAQRHFRSATGARITLAQAWEGELSGTRLKRAAEVADRVLWVVAADHHAGDDIAQRRELLGRSAGVAAVLVEARPRGLPRSVGDTKGYWATRSEHVSGLHVSPARRVPVH